MSAKQPSVAEDGGAFVSHVAGMSRNELYKIMSELKKLIEQNQQQARQILIERPALTKSLFQAQIMLGMVRPPRKMPNIQQTLSQQPQPSGQPGQKPNVPPPQTMHVDTGIHAEARATQPQLPVKQQFQLPASVPPPLTFQSQAIPSTTIPSSQQAKGPLNVQMPPISLGQSSQIHSLPSQPPSALQQPPFQSHVPIPSSQMHPPIQSSKIIHQPLQAPMISNPRPPSLQPFQHQLHSQASQNLSFQPSSTAPQLLSQPMFQPGSGPPTSFPQGQLPLPNLPPPQHLYQGSSQVGPDYSSQNVKPMQVDRVAPWAPGPLDNAMPGAQLPGPPPPSLMNPGQTSQAPRPPQLTSEMEKALLQQVMSLTPEQINLLPPEQRQQVLQLQQMLR